MIACDVAVERWPLRVPFRTARETMLDVPVIVVTLSDARGHRGRGEAAGVDYDGETPSSMANDIDAVRSQLHDDIDAIALASAMPPGGARNALDCALWDLRAKRSGISAACRAGLAPLRPLTTAITLGLMDDDALRHAAAAMTRHTLVKVKVDGERVVERVRIVRECLPRASIIVDANQAWDRERLVDLLPALATLGVALVEQPLPRADDAALDGVARLVPIAADESCTDAASLDALAGRYDVVNVKLDKCGGLTEALVVLDRAEELGLAAMVGNMCGSSLAMAPAFLVGQRCRFVDLDGPLLQAGDRPYAMSYVDGVVAPPPAALWG